MLEEKVYLYGTFLDFHRAMGREWCRVARSEFGKHAQLVILASVEFMERFSYRDESTNQVVPK